MTTKVTFNMQSSLDLAVEEALAITNLLSPHADSSRPQPALMTGNKHLLDWINCASAKVMNAPLAALSDVLPDGFLRRDY